MISKWRNLGKSYRVRACCLKRKLYNTMLNYKSVSKCIMGLRDKVALVRTALCILFISQAFCMPKTKKNIKLINKYCNAQNRIKQEKLKIENNIEALYKKYNFPETEFTMGFKPNSYYDFVDFNQNTLNEAANSKNMFQKFKNKNARKIANKARKAHQNVYRIDSPLETTPQFSSFSNFGNCPNFPEVEYPMAATDIWKPNYWSDYYQPVDYTQNNGYEICKPCKIEKKKYKTSVKKVPAKVKTTPPVQNHTTDEICPNNIYTQTTKTPYLNNFIIKDSSSTSKPMEEGAIVQTTPMPTYNDSIPKNDSDDNNYNVLPITNTVTSSNETCDSEPENYICPASANNTSFEEKSAKDSSASKESDIELDEEFTTDEPEYAYSLSTPLPFSTVETWKQTQVIDPYKSLSYPDELDDYFIAVKG